MLLSKLIMWALGDLRHPTSKISYTNETNTTEEETKMKTNPIVTSEPKKSTDLSFEIDELRIKLHDADIKRRSIIMPER